jgi:hypothetical protein
MVHQRRDGVEKEKEKNITHVILIMHFFPPVILLSSRHPACPTSSAPLIWPRKGRSLKMREELERQEEESQKLYLVFRDRCVHWVANTITVS